MADTRRRDVIFYLCSLIVSCALLFALSKSEIAAVGIRPFFWGDRIELCDEDFRRPDGWLPNCSSGKLFYPGEPVPWSWRLRQPWFVPPGDRAGEHEGQRI